MDHNFTDFTKNDGFNAWASSGVISSSTDHVPPPPRPQRTPRAPRTPRIPRPSPALHKRPHYDTYYGEPPAKRPAPSIRVGTGFKWNLQTLAQAADAVESGGKSPVSALNELGVRVAYSVLRQGGPAHCPSFHVAVTVADLRFEGWGHSKREARAAAARACLAALLARAGRVMPAPSPHQDFTSDEPHRFPVSDFQCLEQKTKVNPPPEPMPLPAPLPAPVKMDVTNGKEGGGGGDSVASPFGACAAGAAHKSPINVLYENYAGLAFCCTFGDGSPLSETQAPLQLSHSMRFKVVCQIKDHKFEGYGSSKKLAKLAAARSALAALEDTRRDSPPAAPPAGALHQTLADHIGKLVNEKFNELMKNDLVHSKRKVLAGIVITTYNRIEDARVIAVTTGTKCVSGEHMSVSGRAVNDCHAEVAARRCLQRHLYAQLLMYAKQPDPSQPLEESDIEPLAGGGYQLKPSRAVHLYVSTAPCGDGRIFSPHEHHHAEPDKHPNRLARGQLRTKIESGEGTIPVKNCNNVLQTWDGVMQGERLLTMSCSDKVARWSVCGLQGALLSRLLRPVYLQSLVLGSLLHPHHMYRAICGRFEAYISSLPPPFHLQRPLLSRAASTEARTPARAPSFSVCWCSTQQLPEVINATTGKLESGQPSLLCKQSMFARWHYLVKRLPLLPQDIEPGDALPEMPDKPDALLYNEAKQMCPTYQLAKQRLIDAFEKAKLGRWIKRPLEQDQFVCEIADADPSLLFAWAGPTPAACGVAGESAADCGHTTVQAHVTLDRTASNRGDSQRERVSALRQPLSASGCASDRVNGHASTSTNVADNGNHGNVGTRSLSYYNYRNNNTCGVSHNNSIILQKNNQSSISSRVLQARVKSYNLSNNRSVLDRNNVSFSVDDDNYWEGLDIGDDSNDEESDDEIDRKQSYNNDRGNVSVASNERSVAVLKNDFNDKVTQNNQTIRFHIDKDIRDITHKMIDVSLDDEKKQFWSDFYKRRNSKHAVFEELTKDTQNDVISSKRSNVGDDLDNFSDSVFREINVDSLRLRLRTIDCSRPRALHTKEKQADEFISKPNVDDRSTDVTDNVFENRRFRDFKVGASGKLRHPLVKDKNIPILRQPKEMRFKNNDLTKFEEDEKENTESNKILRESVTSSLLLRRMNVYEKICTKNK